MGFGALGLQGFRAGSFSLGFFGFLELPVVFDCDRPDRTVTMVDFWASVSNSQASMQCYVSRLRLKMVSGAKCLSSQGAVESQLNATTEQRQC